MQRTLLRIKITSIVAALPAIKNSRNLLHKTNIAKAQQYLQTFGKNRANTADSISHFSK